jgi:hypothetical protein
MGAGMAAGREKIGESVLTELEEAEEDFWFVSY